MKKYSKEVANNILLTVLDERVSHYNNLEMQEIPEVIPACLSIFTGSKRKSDNYSNGIVIKEYSQDIIN